MKAQVSLTVNEAKRIIAKGIAVSGIPESLPDCVAPHEKCKVHKGCIYKKTKGR